MKDNNKETLKSFKDMASGMNGITEDSLKPILNENNQFIREELNKVKSTTDRGVGLNDTDEAAMAAAEHENNILGQSGSSGMSETELNKIYEESDEMLDAIFRDYIDKMLGFK